MKKNKIFGLFFASFVLTLFTGCATHRQTDATPLIKGQTKMVGDPISPGKGLGRNGGRGDSEGLRLLKRYSIHRAPSWRRGRHRDAPTTATRGGSENSTVGRVTTVWVHEERCADTPSRPQSWRRLQYWYRSNTTAAVPVRPKERGTDTAPEPSAVKPQ